MRVLMMMSTAVPTRWRVAGLKVLLWQQRLTQPECVDEHPADWRPKRRSGWVWFRQDHFRPFSHESFGVAAEMDVNVHFANAGFVDSRPAATSECGEGRPLPQKGL